MIPRRRRGAALPLLAATALLVGVLLGASLVAFNAFARRQPDAGGRAREALVVDGPLVLLPAFAETQNSRDLSGLLFRGLTRTGPDGKPVGELARAWEVDADARNFTFHLRPGLHWSDGAPVTSADALYTLSVLQSDGDARSSAGQAWAGITAAAPNANTVRYTLPQPSPAFISLTNMGLLPQHTLEPRPVKTLRSVADAPTTGPFSVQLAAADHVLLQRNRHAFETPFLDELDLRLFDSRSRALQALLAGEVDLFAGLTPADARRVASAVNRRVVRGSTFAYAELLFNQKLDKLSDDRVRQALGLAVDRIAAVQGPLGGYATPDDGPIPPAVKWALAPGAQPAQDQAAARRALDAAGWTQHGASRSRAGQALKLKLLAPAGPPYTALAAAMARDLGRVGVGVTVQPLPAETLLSQLQAHQYDLALTAVDNGPDPDIYVFWHSSQSGPGGFNFSGMAASAALDKDLEDGRSTADYGKRRAAYLDAQAQIRGAHAALFLYSPQALVGVRDFLMGVSLPPGGQRYDRAQDWFVNSHRRL